MNVLSVFGRMSSVLPSCLPPLLRAFPFSGFYRAWFSQSAFGVTFGFGASLYVDEEFGVAWCVCVCVYALPPSKPGGPHLCVTYPAARGSSRCVDALSPPAGKARPP